MKKKLLRFAIVDILPWALFICVFKFGPIGSDHRVSTATFFTTAIMVVVGIFSVAASITYHIIYGHFKKIVKFFNWLLKD